MEREAPLISVTISSYNRAAMLEGALASIAGSVVDDAAAVEVVVIDNNSTDATPDVVGRLRRDYPFKLRYAREVRQGLSHGRNRGVREARGRYIVFMDDDEEIDPNYLARVAPIFEKTGASCIGGPIFHRNADQLPDWLVPLSKVHGQRYLGNRMRILGSHDEPLWGGNMAFVRRDLLEVGEFDTRLGRSGSERMAGEEYDMQARFHALGKKIVYHPGLVQHHYHLTPQLRTKRYWRKHYFYAGRTRYLMSGDRWASANRVLRAPRNLWWRLFAEDMSCYLRACTRRDSATRFQRELALWREVGMIYESRRGYGAQRR